MTFVYITSKWNLVMNTIGCLSANKLSQTNYGFAQKAVNTELNQIHSLQRDNKYLQQNAERRDTSNSSMSYYRICICWTIL